MLSLINFVEAATTAVFIVRIILAAMCLLAVAFIIYVVMKQSGNSDGIEAMTGSSDKSDESETYYGQNAGSRKEAKLKLWTYISAGVLAVACIALIILSVIFPTA